MTHSYIAFIDESGDDGLGNYREPGAQGGSSNWLVISCCLMRATRSLEAVSWRDEIKRQMPEKKGRDLHFAHLNHGQRLLACQVLGSKPVKLVSVLAAKRPIPEGIYTAKNQLYFYMTRYLLERVSWLCRDLRPEVPEGDGRVKITFSRRGGMQYGDFRDYLSRMKAADEQDIRIHWPVIDIGAVDARDHSTSATLQLADTAASAFAAAVEPDRYGNCEPRYASILKPVTYQRGGNFLSYGVKFVPKLGDCGLAEHHRRGLAIFE